MISGAGADPSIDSGRVVVRADDQVAWWSPADGFDGDVEMVEEAWSAVASERLIDVGGALIIAGDTDQVRAAAALFALRPGRSELVDSADSVTESIWPDDEALDYDRGEPHTSWS